MTTDSFAAGKQAAAPLLVSAVVDDPETGTVTVFALNRSVDEEMELTAELRGMGERRLQSAQELQHSNPKAINSKEAPNTIAPIDHPAAALSGAMLTAKLKPLSWNVFVTALK